MAVPKFIPDLMALSMHSKVFKTRGRGGVRGRCGSGGAIGKRSVLGRSTNFDVGGR